MNVCMTLISCQTEKTPVLQGIKSYKYDCNAAGPKADFESVESIKQTSVHNLTRQVAPLLAMLHFLPEQRGSFISQPENQKHQEQNALEVVLRCPRQAIS